MVPPFGDKSGFRCCGVDLAISPHRERDLRVGKLRSKHLTHTSKKGARETDVQSDVQRCGNPKCLLFIIILSIKMAINWKYTTRFHP